LSKNNRFQDVFCELLKNYGTVVLWLAAYFFTAGVHNSNLMAGQIFF